MFLVGTSGFQYRDWVPVFYPRSLEPRGWLRHYSRHFGCCELGMTHYRIPEGNTIQEFMDEAGGEMQFLFRVPFRLAEEHPENEELARRFVSALWPLWEAGQLAAVVVRFGPGFEFVRDHYDRLCRLRDALGGLPLVAEFACPAWRTERAARHLRAARVALACLDGEPDGGGEGVGASVGGSCFATAPLSYVRFQGRNQSRWIRGNGSEQHDYLYSRAELEAVLPVLRRLEGESERVVVLMNNPWRGQAAVNARMLVEMLAGG